MEDELLVTSRGWDYAFETLQYELEQELKNR